MSYDGLRDWLVQVDAMNELRTLEGSTEISRWALSSTMLVKLSRSMIPPDVKVLMNSRAVIDACRPYEWLKDFPEVAETSPELRKTVLERFGRSFFGLR